MAVARMRFAKQAIQELRAEDPDTRVTEHYIRKLIKSGEIPTVKIGNNRHLINYDALLEYLATPHEEQEEKEYGVIRRLV